MNTILYDYVCEELEDVERDGLKAGNLDSTDKLVNIKKNLLKIEKYESEMDGGYSMGGGYWEAQGSYAGEPMNDGYSNARRGGHWQGARRRWRQNCGHSRSPPWHTYTGSCAGRDAARH